MTQPSARIIADSVSPDGIRLTTMEVVMHRFVLAEFNTHRMFSRNSASSRAIPVQKQIDRVINDTAFPVEFGSNQPGMQAGPPLVGKELEIALDIWEDAARTAVLYAENLMKAGVHKQITNRLLEPFMWHTVIITSSEFSNFFEQRCSTLAQPEIRIAAEQMLEVFNGSVPNELSESEWHLPYVKDDEQHLDLETKMKISVARCARVSYLTQNGLRNIQEDITLYDRLATAEPPHWSPMEHVARPESRNINTYGLSYIGNSAGWLQLRHNDFLFE